MDFTEKNNMGFPHQNWPSFHHHLMEIETNSPPKKMSSPINQKGLIRKLEDDFEQLGQWMDILILPYLLYSWVINCYKPLPMEHQVVRTNTLWVPNDSCVSSLSSTKHLELTNKQTRFSKTNDIYIYGYIYIWLWRTGVMAKKYPSEVEM